MHWQPSLILVHEQDIAPLEHTVIHCEHAASDEQREEELHVLEGHAPTRSSTHFNRMKQWWSIMYTKPPQYSQYSVSRFANRIQYCCAGSSLLFGLGIFFSSGSAIGVIKKRIYTLRLKRNSITDTPVKIVYPM